MTVDLPALRAQLTRHEGRRLFPYVDTVGKVTIGVGRCLTDRGISEEECDLLLETDIYACFDILAKWPWLGELDPVRQQVLFNMRFNLGFGGFADFHDLISALKVPDYVAAVQAMRSSKLARQVPARMGELIAMMERGEVM
jgi:lysozyme